MVLHPQARIYEDEVGEKGEVNPPVDTTSSEVLILIARLIRTRDEEGRRAGAVHDDEEHGGPEPGG